MNSGRTTAATVAGGVVALVALLVGPLGAPVLGQRATASDGERCSRFAFQSAVRERLQTGQGDRVAVLGDSYSVGLGLAEPGRSWPARLHGRTTVFGFSGSGFGAGSSPCQGAAYAERVGRAAASADTVVVEGGLNDTDRSAADIRRGVRLVLGSLRGHRVLVVGPAPAPARAAEVPRVDAILAAECARSGVAYLSMADQDFPYLADRLHLTRKGHRMFGSLVAARLDALR